MTLVYGLVTEFGTGEELPRISVSLTPVSAMPEDGNLDEISIEDIRTIRFTRRSSSTDPDGRFELRNVDPGDYYLQAERAGYFRPDEPDPRGTLINVPDDTLRALSLELLFGAVIEGQVSDEAGEPLGDIQVVAQQWVYRVDGPVLEDVVLPSPVSFSRSFGNVRDTSVTNSQGVYRLAGLMPGEYQVVARHKPSTDSSEEDADPQIWGPVYYPATDRADQAGRVRVEMGAEVLGIDIEWRQIPTITIRGRVVGDTRALDLATLLAQGAVDLSIAETGGESNATLDVSIDSSGDFELLAVGFRPYVLTAQVKSTDPSQAYIGHTPIEVEDEDFDGVLVTVESPIPLSGRIVPVGAPPGGFRFGQLAVDLIDLTETEPIDGLMSVFDDGTFFVDNLALHDYHVRLDGLPDGMYLESGRYGWTDPFMRRFSPGDDPGATLDIRIGTLPGRITGIVRPENGETYRNAKISLVPQGVNRDRYDLYRAMSAETDGSFTFDNVPPGSYRVFAWNIPPEPSALMDSYFILPFESLGTFVLLEPAGEVEAEVSIIVR